MQSRTQPGPGRAVKQEQEENSRNHVRTFKSDPVLVRLNECFILHARYVATRKASAKISSKNEIMVLFNLRLKNVNPRAVSIQRKRRQHARPHALPDFAVFTSFVFVQKPEDPFLIIVNRSALQIKSCRRIRNE